MESFSGASLPCCLGTLRPRKAKCPQSAGLFCRKSGVLRRAWRRGSAQGEIRPLSADTYANANAPKQKALATFGEGKVKSGASGLDWKLMIGGGSAVALSAPSGPAGAMPLIAVHLPALRRLALNASKAVRTADAPMHRPGQGPGPGNPGPEPSPSPPGTEDRNKKDLGSVGSALGRGHRRTAKRKSFVYN